MTSRIHGPRPKTTTAAGPTSARTSVLVVDNEPSMAAVATRVLQHDNDISWSASGADALARIHCGGDFDVILCDVLMPGMTGIEFVRALTPRQAASVVFVTGAAWLPALQDFLAGVPNEVLEKPFTRAALCEVVERMGARERRLRRGHEGVVRAPDTRAAFDAVADCDESAYVLARDLRLLRVNAGWTTFAHANDGGNVLEGWAPGASFVAALPAPLREFYVGAFERVFATGERWEHEYDCSSATRYRTFRMAVYPMGTEAILVVNARVVDAPHDRPDHRPDDVYAVDGVVTMCASCRRVRFPPSPTRWDWVSAYVARPPERVSHGLCAPCTEFYFPGDDPRSL